MPTSIIVAIRERFIVSKKSHTWRTRAVNAKTGTSPVVPTIEKPTREKHPDPAWILPIQAVEPTNSETHAVLAGK